MGLVAFGELFRNIRLDRGMTLREFCTENKFDPGNISKIERGRMAPQSEVKLARYAKALGLAEGSKEWREFVELGLACAGQIPKDILTDEELVKKLPLLLRTVSGKKLSGEQLDEFIEMIRRA